MEHSGKTRNFEEKKIWKDSFIIPIDKGHTPVYLLNIICYPYINRNNFRIKLLQWRFDLVLE